MRRIKDVLRLKLESKLSNQQIATVLRISKGCVGKYVKLARLLGLQQNDLATLTERDLERQLSDQGSQPLKYVLPDYGRVHHELRHKTVTLMLLWEEYYNAQEDKSTVYKYTQFCHHYREFAKTLKRSMRQIHVGGEKLFIDFAGPTVALRDGSRGQIFVAAMGASSYTFACATAHQRMEDWLGALSQALTFFGGVPQLIVPDNPKSLVASPDRYSPDMAETVQDFARHYGVSWLPARPYKPKDKSKAELAVQIVERWILARLRHQTFENLAELNVAIRPWIERLNQKNFQKMPGNRFSAFTLLDAPALRPLPLLPYEFARFKWATVRPDYHVRIEGHDYSVPNALIGKAVEARITQNIVEILYRGDRVASHERSSKHGEHTTLQAHMPEAHQAYRSWTPEVFVHWAKTIGMATETLVSRLLEAKDHPQSYHRRHLGFQNLERKYGAERLEAACTVALQLNTHEFKHVRDILINHRDRVTLITSSDASIAEHSNLRGSGYYQ